MAGYLDDIERGRGFVVKSVLCEGMIRSGVSGCTYLYAVLPVCFEVWRGSIIEIL